MISLSVTQTVQVYLIFHIPSLEVRWTFFNVSIVVPIENKLFEIHFYLFYLIIWTFRKSHFQACDFKRVIILNLLAAVTICCFRTISDALLIRDEVLGMWSSKQKSKCEGKNKWIEVSRLSLVP